MPDPAFGLGMNSSDFQMLQNQFNPATQEQDQGAIEAAQAAAQVHQQAMAGLGDLGARLSAQAKAEAAPPTLTNYSAKTGPDGVTKFSVNDLTQDQMAYFQKAASFYQQALGGYAQQVQQLEMQLQQAQSQPWQQLATALSANLASAPGMPGWVQGLGRTAAQLNPTVDELRQRYLATAGKGAEIAEKGMGLGIAQERTALDTKQAELARKTLADEEKRTNDFVKQARLAAKPGTPMPREEFEAKADLYRIPMDKREALYQGHVAAAAAIVGQEQRVLANRTNFAKTVSDLAENRQIDVAKATAPIKMGIMREAFQLTHGDAALEFEKRKKEIDSQISLGLAQAKATGVLDPSSVGMLRAGLGTNIYIGSLGNMLKIPEIASSAEPAFLVDRDKKTGNVTDVRFNPEAVLPQAWKSIPRTEAENMIAHEMPRILALLFKQGVGAQMFRSQKGVELLNSLGVSNKIRVDQMEAILDNIRHTNNLSNFAPVVMTKRLAWQNDPDLKAMIGADDPKNATFWQGLDQFGGKIQVRFPTGTPSVSGPPAGAAPTAGLHGQTTQRPRAVNPKTKEVMEWDGESWVKLGQ